MTTPEESGRMVKVLTGAELRDLELRQGIRGIDGPTGVNGSGPPGVSGPPGFSDGPGATPSPPMTDLSEVFFQLSHWTMGPQKHQHMETMRKTAQALAQQIITLCPKCADRTVAIRQLRECIMYAEQSLLLPNRTNQVSAQDQRQAELAIRLPSAAVVEGFGTAGVTGLCGPHDHHLDPATHRCETCNETEDILRGRGDTRIIQGKYDPRNVKGPG